MTNGQSLFAAVITLITILVHLIMTKAVLMSEHHQEKIKKHDIATMIGYWL